MKIEFTEDELADLYDMLYMMDSGTIKMNGCQDTWNSLFDKIEPIVCPELYKKEEDDND